MTRRVPRRLFLGAVAGASVGLAGCAGDMPWDGEEPTDDTDPVDVDDDGDDVPEETNDDDTTPDEPDEVTPPAIDHGTLVSDFSEDLDSWISMTGSGTVDGDSDEALVGDTAALVRGSGERAGVFRSFGDFDAEGQHVSFAVKLAQPMGGRVNVELLAPYSSDSVVTRRRIPRDLDGWMRMDVGYTQDRGEPSFGDINEMRIWVDAAASDGEADDDGDIDETVRFHVDDLRTTPAADNGQVILTFDGGFESHYTTLFDLMEERDLQGVIGIVPPTVNVGGRLSIDQMREMRDAGWDMASFPLRRDSLPEMDSGEKRQVIEGDQSYLEGRGFPDGSRVFLAPYHHIDAESLEIVREVHDCSMTFGGTPNAAPPADPHMLSRINAHEMAPVERFTELAERHDQLLVLRLTEVHDDADVTTEYVETMLDYLEESDLEVVTASEMLDQREELFGL